MERVRENEQRRISDIEDSEYQQIYKNENIFSDNKDFTVRHDLANYLYLHIPILNKI